jgi:hypothetical protein
MPAHKLSKYEAEYKVFVEYCSVCGAEDNELSKPCPGDSEKKVDKVKERS